MADVGVKTRVKDRAAKKLLKSEINNAKQLLNNAKAEDKQEIAAAEQLLLEEKAEDKQKIAAAKKLLLEEKAEDKLKIAAAKQLLLEEKAAKKLEIAAAKQFLKDAAKIAKVDKQREIDVAKRLLRDAAKQAKVDKQSEIDIAKRLLKDEEMAAKQRGKEEANKARRASFSKAQRRSLSNNTSQERPETTIDIDIKKFNEGYNTDTIFVTCGCCGQELGGKLIAKEKLSQNDYDIIKSSFDRWLLSLSVDAADAAFIRLLIENVPNGLLRGCGDCCL